MSYLPGLRASLVDAARRRHAGAPQSQQRRSGRRRWLTTGGIATALAAAVAVVVAVVAVVALGHHRTTTPIAASPTVTRVDLHRAAEQALSQLVLPRGAAHSGLVRGTPIELWSASDRLRIPHHVDVYRVWRLRESPESVMTFIEAHGPAGSMPGPSSETSYTNGAGGRPVIGQATGEINLPVTPAGIWRELAIDAVILPHGATALRVDSEAGWLPLRRVSERIPSGVERVQLEWSLRGPLRHGPVLITNPQRVKPLVALFNSLPAAPANATCRRAPDGLMRFVFEGAAGQKPPIAVAVWAPPCLTFGLKIGRGPNIRLMESSPTLPPGAQIGSLLASSLPPMPGSTQGPRPTTTVNSSRGCATSTSSTSVRPPSAPGAAGGSCASVSPSTTGVTLP